MGFRPPTKSLQCDVSAIGGVGVAPRRQFIFGNGASPCSLLELRARVGPLTAAYILQLNRRQDHPALSTAR